MVILNPSGVWNIAVLIARGVITEHGYFPPALSTAEAKEISGCTFKAIPLEI